jgi:hypothetical protein
MRFRTSCRAWATPAAGVLVACTDIVATRRANMPARVMQPTQSQVRCCWVWAGACGREGSAHRPTRVCTVMQRWGVQALLTGKLDQWHPVSRGMAGGPLGWQTIRSGAHSNAGQNAMHKQSRQ